MSKEELYVPDYTERMIGFRSFVPNHQGYLNSNAMGSAHIWDIGPNKAICARGFDDPRGGCKVCPSPGDSDCGDCGLYCFNSVDKLSYDGCYGVVSLWGRTEMHKDGFRAEYMEIHAITPHIYSSGKLTKRNDYRCKLASERYGIPLVTKSRLQAKGLEFGSLVPQEALQWFVDEEKRAIDEWHKRNASFVKQLSDLLDEYIAEHSKKKGD